MRHSAGIVDSHGAGWTADFIGLGSGLDALGLQALSATNTLRPIARLRILIVSLWIRSTGASVRIRKSRLP
jgi:hypothetical protein